MSGKKTLKEQLREILRTDLEVKAVIFVFQEWLLASKPRLYDLLMPDLSGSTQKAIELFFKELLGELEK